VNTRLPLLVALATVACAGGGGPLSQSLETQDRAPISNEGVSSSLEGSARSNEGAGNTTESAARSTESSPTGGGFSCAGTYACSFSSSAGKGSSDGVVLTNGPGGCQALDDDDDDRATLAPDGTIIQKGKVVASWTPTGNGFAYSATARSDGQTITLTITCTKISDSTTPPPRDKDGDNDPPPVVILDAGAPR